MALPRSDANPAAVEIRGAHARDIPQVSDLLGRAFFDDPVFAWVVPDDRRRRRNIRGFFALFANAVQRYQETYTAGGGIGAALWVPPGQAPIADEDAEEFGARVEALAGPDAPRLFDITAAMEEHHPTEPHQYLWFLGVHPVWQGRGIGSAMLTPMLQRCDANGTAAYLEATSEHNARLYERHGFHVTGRIDEHGGAPLWPMWREPARGRA
jgi:ribosomal protein S18 acetylase RimI-like enzyme